MTTKGDASWGACLHLNTLVLTSMAVQIIDVCTVKPLHETDRHTIVVAAEDTFFRGFPYIREVLFYKTTVGDASHAEVASLMESLRRGLSKVLVEFYPVAGRLVAEPDGRLSLDCNDAGVQFVEASIDAPFDELEQQHFPIRSFFDELVPMARSLYGLNADDVALCIQVTRFQGGGGIAVGCAAGHVVMDGQSYWHFLKSWGECCRGEGVSMAPFHVRAVLRPECWREGPTGCETTRGSLGHAAFPPRPPQELQRVMHFSKDVVEQLKQASIKESGNVRLSSFQVVLACVWKRLIHAQADSLPPDQHVWLLLPIDIRSRLRPQLTPAYFGNALKPALVHVSPRELLATHTLASTAAHIHEVIREATKDANIKDLLAMDKLSLLLHEAFSHDINFTLVAQGSKFPIYDIDLGFGTPIASRPALVFENFVLVYPSKDPGGIDVCICLPNTHVLNAFLQQSTRAIDI